MATQVLTVPVATRNRRRNRNGGSMPKITMSGSDIIGNVSVKNNTSVGRVLFTVPISPAALVDTRLKQISRLYSRWRPLSLSLNVIGSGSSTTFGSLAVGWLPDSSNQIIGTDSSNVQRVMACRPSRMVRMNQTTTLRIPPETNRKWYVVQGPPDDSHHGSIVVACAAQTGGYTGLTTFSLQLTWRAEFEGAELETSATDEYITPDAGYVDLFTTSDGSWNSGILTLKQHHGGSMVPFSAAHPAKVYIPAGNTQVPYYLEDEKTLKYAKWFAVVQGYSTPGFVMFSSRDDALNYIQTGNTDKCLKYYTQGPVCTPSVLNFEANENASVSKSERERYDNQR